MDVLWIQHDIICIWHVYTILKCGSSILEAFQLSKKKKKSISMNIKHGSSIVYSFGVIC